MFEFQPLYLKYNKEIFLFLFKMTNYDYHLAEELTQETFYQLYLSLSRFKGNCDIKTWICSIAKNVCLKYYRKNANAMNLEHIDKVRCEQIDFSKTPLELFELQESAENIKSEILRMKKKYRDVLCYRLYFDMSFREIGQIMNISEGSAKVLYHRGRNIIKTRLEGAENGK